VFIKDNIQESFQLDLVIRIGDQFTGQVVMIGEDEVDTIDPLGIVDDSRCKVVGGKADKEESGFFCYVVSMAFGCREQEDFTRVIGRRDMIGDVLTMAVQDVYQFEEIILPVSLLPLRAFQYLDREVVCDVLHIAKVSILIGYWFILFVY
jgi:hypothetical protein